MYAGVDLHVLVFRAPSPGLQILLALPVLGALLTPLLLLRVALSWARRQGSLPARAVYSLAAVAAIATPMVLRGMGLLG